MTSRLAMPAICAPSLDDRFCVGLAQVTMLIRRALLVLLVGALLLRAQTSASAPKREDIKYIRCGVCQLLAKNAYKQVKEMFKQATPSTPVTEGAVIERMENMAKALKDEGEWVAKLDLVEEGDKLVVKEMEELGDCDVECKTVERAAQDILDDHDTDVAEALFVGKKTRAQLTNWLCYELTNSCNTQPPPLPKDRVPGPEFKKGDPEKRKMERMLAEGNTAIPRPFNDNLDMEDLDEEDMTPQQKADAAVRRLDKLSAARAKHDPDHPLHRVEAGKRRAEDELRIRRRHRDSEL